MGLTHNFHVKGMGGKKFSRYFFVVVLHQAPPTSVCERSLIEEPDKTQAGLCLEIVAKLSHHGIHPMF